ncbi:unnamed protein product [Urochloa decumbens]|uniref:Uncharacterized protein n=1 Tax=Urochloa decumbens TaxID=240449 RepID=A0ABC9D159_9POAL
MAALRPCPSSSLHLSHITLSPRIVRSVGRQGSASLLNLRTSTARTAHLSRHRHAIAAHRGAGPSGKDPGYEKRLMDAQVKMLHEIFKEHEMQKDMPFQEDIEKIDEYVKATTSWNTSIFHIEATTYSLFLCLIVTKGVKLASRVMDRLSLRLDNQDKISSCTTKQTLAMYVSIFVKLAKDTYDKKFNDESVFSLLGAFRGVAAVGHILLQDSLANVNYVGYSDSLVLDADDTWRVFGQTMDNLEETFRVVSNSTKAYEVLMPTMVNAIIQTILFISDVVARHQRLLGYVPGTSRVSDDGEPGALGTSSDSM